MKYRIVMTVVLCCVVLITAISCDTGTQDPMQSIESEPATAASTDAELETPAPMDWSMTTDRYSVREIDGRCYVTFKDEYRITEEDRLACQLMEIYFDSMGDMIRAFRNNALTSDQETILQAHFPQTDNGIALWRTDRLFSVTAPDGVDASSLALHGETYDYYLQGDSFGSGWVACLADWTLDKERMYDWSEGATVTRQEDSTFDGVPCRIVEYENSTEAYRDIFIETERDGKKVDMVIRYLLEDHRSNPDPVSDTAPWCVQMFCEDNGVYYHVYMKEFTETPTFAWLSAFGLTPYVPSVEDTQPVA